MSRTKIVPNTERRFGEADFYRHFRLTWPGGDVLDYLATRAELEPLRQRAIKQPEDIPPRPSRWRRVLDALFGT